MQQKNTHTPVSAIVLASGAGTRLSDITRSVPKPLLQFQNKPFLEYLINWLIRHEILDIVVTTYTHADQMSDYIASNPAFANIVTIAEEPALRDTIASTQRGLECVRHDTTFLLTADNLWEVDLRSMHEQHIARKAKATVLATARTGVANVGKMLVGPNDQVVRMWPEEHILTPQDIPLISASTMGLYLFDKKALVDAIKSGGTSIEREPSNRLLPNVYAHWCEGFFFDYGTPDKYHWLQQNPDIIHRYL